MNTAEWLPFMMPITLILGGFAAGIVAMVLKARTREQQHKERIFLAEKGLEIPPQLYEVREPKKPSEFRGFRAVLMVLGWVTLVVGVGVLIALSLRDGFHEGVNGLFPIFVGAGILLAERMITLLIVRRNRDLT